MARKQEYISCFKAVNSLRFFKSRHTLITALLQVFFYFFFIAVDFLQHIATAIEIHGHANG